MSLIPASTGGESKGAGRTRSFKSLQNHPRRWGGREMVKNADSQRGRWKRFWEKQGEGSIERQRGSPLLISHHTNVRYVGGGGGESLSGGQLFVNTWTAACQASLCHPLLLSIFPSIRVFSSVRFKDSETPSG